MDINQWIQNIRDDGLETKQLIGIAGASAVFVGAFTPVETFEMIGNSSLMSSSDLAGIAVLLLSVATLAVSLFNRCRFFWATGTGIVLTLAMSIVSILSKTNYSFENLQWGWIVLFIGAILIFSAAALEELSRHS